jgi:hypothetical protein
MKENYQPNALKQQPVYLHSAVWVNFYIACRKFRTVAKHAILITITLNPPPPPQSHELQISVSFHQTRGSRDGAVGKATRCKPEGTGFECR